MADHDSEKAPVEVEKPSETTVGEKELDVEDEKPQQITEKPAQALAIIVDSPPTSSTPSAPSSPSSRSSSSSSTRSPSPPPTTRLPMQTPAPASFRSSTPSAPAPKPIPKDLPTQTPASSSTPRSANQARDMGKMDLSEFDPFATPAPGPAKKDAEEISIPTTTETGLRAGPSTPRPAGRERQQQQQDREEEEETQEPTFNFSGFLKDLRMKSAEPIAKYLKSFLTNFAKKPFTVNEQIKLIHDFLAFIQEKMEHCEPWKSQSEAELDNAAEAMEKLVMNRLYNYTFTPQLVPSQPITTDDLERDGVFAQRVRLFGWIREKHLDVPEGEASQGFLGFAQQELLKINHYKAPRDKMICILNCCKVIFGLLRHANNGSEDTSADAFVPILIFVVLQASPENMISNIEYINRFRASSKLTGEAGYYLSSLTGAIQFIETMDSSSLSNITQTEFEDSVSAAIADLPPSPTSLRRSLASGIDSHSPSPFSPTTPGEEPARALSMLGGLDGTTKRFFQKTGEVVSKPLGAIGKILEGIQGDTPDGEGSQRRAAPEPRRRARREREETPESPSQRLSQLGISDSMPPSGAVTPQREVPIPDFSFSPQQIQETVEASQETYEYTRRANVQTLQQMFPTLDAEILEAVLEGCNEDLGIAIDRLLEM